MSELNPDSTCTRLGGVVELERLHLQWGYATVTGGLAFRVRGRALRATGEREQEGGALGKRICRDCRKLPVIGSRHEAKSLRGIQEFVARALEPTIGRLNVIFDLVRPHQIRREVLRGKVDAQAWEWTTRT